MTSQHKTGTHPFYIGMYIDIYTHIYVHIYTSQKECLHIFVGLEALALDLIRKQHVTARRGHASETAEPQQDSGPMGGHLVCRAGAIWASSNPLKAKEIWALWAP